MDQRAGPAKRVPGRADTTWVVGPRGRGRCAWTAAAGAALFGAWLATWHLWLGALWWAVAAGMVARRASRRAWLVHGLVGAALVPWCLWRYDQRATALMSRVLARGPDALGTADMVAVWGLNLLMATAGAALGLPEVAAETARLALPGPADREVVAGDFPRCAPKLAALVHRWQAQARDGRTAFGPTRVAWRYGEPGTSARAALALNPVTVSGRVVGRDLALRFEVAVDYPPNHRLAFGRIGPLSIAVEEGLFHALEVRGWLHPYG